MTSETMSCALLRWTAFFLAMTTVAITALRMAHTIITIIAMASGLAEETLGQAVRVLEPSLQAQAAGVVEASHLQ